ncbi:MAG: Asp-tRNA(Asn)/Glu-tRNA(Gln) amidotransferase subunit GatC [Phormidesmis sp. CAN_BIN36]|nr:Asp-tRNA(Asn)/Glu-tRNA(Gln) amidotransferase subunit GatC [Phormidesmis sp. CAN_BIN36]
MLDRAQVQKVAHLARLQLTPEEEEKFTTQLSSILDYFELLSELDVTDVQPTTRAIEVSNVMRVDREQPYSREDILNGAPDREGEFFKVPKIITGD